MNENKFILYYERKDKPENNFLNGITIPCDNIKELIKALEQCLKDEGQNVNIFTVQAAAFML